VTPDQWIFCDSGFLAWGALMLAGERWMWRAGMRETAVQAAIADWAF
jgi:hypothetical protein